MNQSIIATAIGTACLIGLLFIYYGTKRRRPRPNKYLTLAFKFQSITIKSNFMAVSLYPGQFVEGTLQPVDRKGNAASVEAGSVKFTSSDDAVFTVETDPSNELGVKLTAVAPGVAQLNYEADADLDAGDGEIRTISGFAAVEVLPEEAVGFGITFGEAQDAPVL